MLHTSKLNEIFLNFNVLIFCQSIFLYSIWFWSHDRAHLKLKIVMQAILACIYLLLHLTQQVHHDHSSFSISVSNSDSTTSTRHHQLVRYIAICQKNTKLKSDPYLAIDTQTGPRMHTKLLTRSDTVSHHCHCTNHLQVFGLQFG